MSNLEEHARAELERAGLFKPTSDYGGDIGEAVMELVKTFAAQGHSGGSMQITLAAFDRVVRFQTLTPLTSSPDEWMDVGDALWQSKRQHSCFSTDGGKTYYDIDANDNRAVHPTEAP